MLYLRPWEWRCLMNAQQLGHDVWVRASLSWCQVTRCAAGQCGERRCVDFLADAGVFDQRVVDIPEHQAKHLATLRHPWRPDTSLTGLKTSHLIARYERSATKCHAPARLHTRQARTSLRCQHEDR